MRSRRMHPQQHHAHHQAQHQGRVTHGQVEPGLDTIAHIPDNEALRILLHGHGREVPPAIRMQQPIQPVLSTAILPGTIITVPFRNTGLITRFIVKFQATVTAGATSTQTRTPLGAANFLSQAVLNDFSGIQRHNTTGWHLSFIASAKRKRAFGAAFVNDSAFGIGNNNPATPNSSAISGNIAPATIAATTAATIQVFYEIPVSPSHHNLHGAMWAEITQASAQLLLTVNPNMFVTAAQDPTLAMYQSAGSDIATLSNATITVYQDFYEQIPRVGGKYALPRGMLATAYLLNNVATGVLIANQDNAISYVNQRKFLSTFAIYDNNGTLNFGSDVNYWRLVSANLTPIFQFDPQTTMLVGGREEVMDDWPRGVYYFSHRERPIDTDAYGNMQLILNPSSVLGSGSVGLLGYEAFGVLGQVNQGPAIPSGG